MQPKHFRAWLLAIVCGCLATARGPVLAQTPLRDLSGFSGPEGTFQVAITLNAPPGAVVVGAEDAPPGGWTVGAISDGGSWDAVNLKVKWGPYFAPSIPTVLTYDVNVPSTVAGPQCFTGEASFDGQEAGIGGDDCVNEPVPAASAWGVILLALLCLVAATLLVRRERPGSTSWSRM